MTTTGRHQDGVASAGPRKGSERAWGWPTPWIKWALNARIRTRNCADGPTASGLSCRAAHPQRIEGASRDWGVQPIPGSHPGRGLRRR